MGTNTNLEWLEDKRGFSRYATEPEESIWLCQACGEEGDPDEGGCQNEECEEFVEECEE